MTDNKVNKVINILVRNDGTFTLWNHELEGTIYNRSTKKFSDRNVDVLANNFKHIGAGIRRSSRKVQISHQLLSPVDMVARIKRELVSLYSSDADRVGYNIQVNFKKTASTRAHSMMVL